MNAKLSILGNILREKKPVDELILEEKCKREYCRALKNKTGFGKNLSLLGLLLGIR